MQEQQKNVIDIEGIDLPSALIDSLLHEVVLVTKNAEQNESISDATRRTKIGNIVDSFVGRIL